MSSACLTKYTYGLLSAKLSKFKSSQIAYIHNPAVLNAWESKQNKMSRNVDAQLSKSPHTTSGWARNKAALIFSKTTTKCVWSNPEFRFFYNPVFCFQSMWWVSPFKRSFGVSEQISIGRGRTLAILLFAVCVIDQKSEWRFYACISRA